jgi:hypothetical protein
VRNRKRNNVNVTRLYGDGGKRKSNELFSGEDSQSSSKFRLALDFCIGIRAAVKLACFPLARQKAKWASPLREQWDGRFEKAELK